MFETVCTFMIAEPHEKAIEAIKRNGHRSELDEASESDFKKDGDADGLCYSYKAKDGGTFRLLWMKKWEKSNVCIGVLAHECLHLATHIANDKDISISWKNDEALARIQEFYFVRALGRIASLHGAKRISTPK